MKPPKAYIIGHLGGYGAASALLFAVLSGCSTEKESCAIQRWNYKVPQAHIEIHKQLLEEQRKLIIPKRDDESTDD